MFDVMFIVFYQVYSFIMYWNCWVCRLGKCKCYLVFRYLFGNMFVFDMFWFQCFGVQCVFFVFFVFGKVVFEEFYFIFVLIIQDVGGDMVKELMVV